MLVTGPLENKNEERSLHSETLLVKEIQGPSRITKHFKHLLLNSTRLVPKHQSPLLFDYFDNMISKFLDLFYVLNDTGNCTNHVLNSLAKMTRINRLLCYLKYK